MVTLEDEIKVLRYKVNELSVDLDNAYRMNTAQRIVCKLLRMNRAGNDKFSLPMTKGTLALHVGIEAETFSRAIPRLENYGVRIADKTVSFFDKRQTGKTVCDSCAGRHDCPASQVLTGASCGTKSLTLRQNS